MKKIVLFILIGAIGTVSVYGGATEPNSAEKKDDISEILNSMGYPELQVVPRASERLTIEAKGENSGAIFTHWPIELSGLFTIGVGLTAKGNERPNLNTKQKSDADTIGSVTTAVGAGWVIGAVILGLQKPYHAGYISVNKNAGKDERSVLLRERLSEEALERPARVMHLLQTASVLSNFSVNVLVAINSTDNGKVIAGLGALLSFLPWMFEDHNVEVYEKHLEYKRKIYTPIQSASISLDQLHGTLTPMTTLTWTF